tara:strand:- start:257 stop:619 length:363 start_codon:yes stop_codon:yes gene_type:complete
VTDKKYLETHEWFSINDNVITVGISDFAQSELGDIVFVTLPSVDETFSKGEGMVEVEATKTVAEVYAPMDITISEVNNKLDSEPELINSDPCGDGWIIKGTIKELENIGMSYQEYESFIS